MKKRFHHLRYIAKIRKIDLVSIFLFIKMELLPWIDETKLTWEMLSGNPNAIELLRENPDKIDWKILSYNPNAIEILRENPDKIDWQLLSGNPNAIELLRENPDKIDWDMLSGNLKGLRPFQTHGRARETAKRCLYKCDRTIERKPR
jgi:uncharacterized protein YlzI (FlbEa/FlbD family)